MKIIQKKKAKDLAALTLTLHILCVTMMHSLMYNFNICRHVLAYMSSI